MVAPDQLGMGWSERVPSHATLAQRVADLSALTDALGITGPVVTVAHDWGGAVSLGWAVEHRDQLRGIVLSNTAIALPAGTSGPALIRLTNTAAVRDLVCVRTPAFLRATLALSRTCRAPSAGPSGAVQDRRTATGHRRVRR